LFDCRKEPSGAYVAIDNSAWKGYLWCLLRIPDHPDRSFQCNVITDSGQADRRFR